MGTTPQALRKQRAVRTRIVFNASLLDKPLNAELETESTSGKFAERVRDDPQRDEDSNEKDEDAGKERMSEIQPGWRAAAPT